MSLFLGSNISRVSCYIGMKYWPQMRSELMRGVAEGQTRLIRGQQTRLVTIQLRLLVRGPLALRERVTELCRLAMTWFSQLQPGFSIPACQQMRQSDWLSQGMLRCEQLSSARNARQQLQISTIELAQCSEGKRRLLTTTFFLMNSSPMIFYKTRWKIPEAPPSRAVLTTTPCKLSQAYKVFWKVSSTWSQSSLLAMLQPREYMPPVSDLLLRVRLFLQYSLLGPVKSWLVEKGSQSMEMARQLKVWFWDSSKKTGLYLASMRDSAGGGGREELGGARPCSRRQRDKVWSEILMPVCPKLRVMIYFIIPNYTPGLAKHIQEGIKLAQIPINSDIFGRQFYRCNLRGYITQIDNKMDSFPNLTPKEIYSLCSSQQLTGIEGYHIQKKYFDPLRQIQERQSANIKKGEKSRKHVTKRGNFLDDQAKMHSAVPGPGHYIKNEEKGDKSKPKIKYGDKMTYLDEIIKQNKREKIPAPGQYNVVKTLKEEESQVKRLAAKKVTAPDRITYLDEVQYEANMTPGVGSYNPRKRAITQGARSQSNSRLGPDDWRKKHELMQKKKLPKSPDMGTYNPTTGDPALFQNTSKVKHNKNFLGKVERFKTSASGSGLNPAKYTVLQEWRGKDKKKVQRHGLQALSKPATKSVYYH